MVKRAVFVSSAFVLSACCTAEVGCDDFLRLRFDRATSLGYHVEVRSMNDSLLASNDCPGTDGCDATSISVRGFHDAQIIVRVTEPTFVSVDTVVPVYSADNPIHGCSVACVNGDVTVRLATRPATMSRH
jgi:hypothetical protein